MVRLRRLIVRARSLTAAGGSVLCLAISQANAQQRSTHAYVPPEGFVPDSATAVRIAEAVLLPIYGKKVIGNEKPFHASLHDSIWTVNGTLRKGHAGGVATIEIAKADARVLRVTHSK